MSFEICFWNLKNYSQHLIRPYWWLFHENVWTYFHKGTQFQSFTQFDSHKICNNFEVGLQITITTPLSKLYTKLIHFKYNFSWNFQNTQPSHIHLHRSTGLSQKTNSYPPPIILFLNPYMNNARPAVLCEIQSPGFLRQWKVFPPELRIMIRHNLLAAATKYSRTLHHAILHTNTHTHII